MLIGFNKQCITPSLPIQLGGYEGIRIANKIHDDIYIRCIVFNNNNNLYILVQCDLIGIDTILKDKVYEYVKDLHIHKSNIIIVASHTHSGPAGVINTDNIILSQLASVFGDINYDYIDFIVDKINTAVRLSLNDMKETNVKIARGSIKGVGANRHNKENEGDESLLIFHFVREDKKEILLYNYACHPTVTGPDNTMMTADFPYAVENKLDYDMTMFVNSCAGDISSRFTRIDSSFNQAELYSHIIIDSINKALESPIYEGALNNIDIKDYIYNMPIKKVKDVEESIKEYEYYKLKLMHAIHSHTNPNELRILGSYVEGAKVAISLSKCLKGINSLDIHYSIIKIQNILIVTIPGELFSTLGRVLKDNNIEVFGYGNGYYLYIGDSQAYDLGYYEAMSSIFEKGAGELLVNDIIEKAKVW